MEVYDRIINFKKSEVFILFVLVLLIGLVFTCLPFVRAPGTESIWDEL